MVQPRPQLDTATEPDEELLLVNQPGKTPSLRKTGPAALTTAKYKPLTRRLGMPNTMPWRRSRQAMPRSTAALQMMRM
jgi:hypothetical protein